MMGMMLKRNTTSRHKCEGGKKRRRRGGYLDGTQRGFNQEKKEEENGVTLLGLF